MNSQHYESDPSSSENTAILSLADPRSRNNSRLPTLAPQKQTIEENEQPTGEFGDVNIISSVLKASLKNSIHFSKKDETKKDQTLEDKACCILI
ncbi:unnamed protein product [Blepharisma stoltei]|uniref:Uncharacterized protein n=1 Tax=Blepharisma stoltei TaxID=1481888 RepID=A0AAU9JCH0_9CILI|nr:unnamed protein product [Blepharisma stoltei]